MFLPLVERFCNDNSVSTREKDKRLTVKHEETRAYANI